MVESKDKNENEVVIHTLIDSYKLLEEKLTSIEKKIDDIDKKLGVN